MTDSKPESMPESKEDSGTEIKAESNTEVKEETPAAVASGVASGVVSGSSLPGPDLTPKEQDFLKAKSYLLTASTNTGLNL